MRRFLQIPEENYSVEDLELSAEEIYVLKVNKKYRKNNQSVLLNLAVPQSARVEDA
ncbi:hypothetical protein K9L97_00420 [Candidatus Woesearchaeota archaeon]|nr:hypothetical protein [Candidatus Woesearchaeota archaeon]